MHHTRSKRSPPPYLDALFDVTEKGESAVDRCPIAFIDREIGRARFMGEMRRRGFRVLECGCQFVVIRSETPVQVVM